MAGKYTLEQLESVETFMEMLAAIPKDRRAEVVRVTTAFVAGMEAQRAIQSPGRIATK